jgi:predicted nucleic acid-binding protein
LSYLLDASALLSMLIDYGEELLNIAAKTRMFILDLTLYEVGNGLWKLIALSKTLELSDAEDLLYVLKGLVRKNLIEIIKFDKLNLLRILQIAVNERLTFYDASYLEASEAVGATLVTEDAELRKKGLKYTAVIDYRELKERLQK